MIRIHLKNSSQVSFRVADIRRRIEKWLRISSRYSRYLSGLQKAGKLTRTDIFVLAMTSNTEIATQYQKQIKFHEIYLTKVRILGFESIKMNFRKLSFFIFLITASLTLKAQYNSNFLNYSRSGRSVSLNLDFEAGSNAINSAMMNKLVLGGEIDKELKDQSAKKLRAYNNFGINLNYDVNAFFKGNSKFDFLIGIKNQELTNGYFTRDFYNLLFYGNTAYKGKTADLNNCNFNALRFQEVKFGAIMNKVDSTGKIGVSVSFLKGEQLFYLNTGDNANLYTSSDGSEIIWNSNFSLALSDTGNKRIGSFNGIGASADLFFETTYKSKIGKRSVLIVNANNIGFIYWRNQSVQYQSDSIYKYSGYTVTNFNDLRDTVLGDISRDSIVNQLINNYSSNFNVNIPTNLLIINKIYFGKEAFSFSFGFRHIFNANYIPYVFIEPEYRYKNVTFGLHTGYGGYVRLNVGVSATCNLQNWFFRLGSNSLQGFMFPNKFSGQGLYVTIAKKLK